MDIEEIIQGSEKSRLSEFQSIAKETCPDCGTPVSYELGEGNPICPNKNCDRQLIYY